MRPPKMLEQSHPAHATAPTAQLTYWRRRWRYLRASARRRWLYCLAKGNLFLGRQNSEHISVALPECTLRYMYVPPCLLNFCIRVDRWLHSVPVSTCRERKYPKLPEDNRPLFAQGKVQVIFQLGILNVQWARVKKSVKFLADYREEWSGVEWSSTAEWSSRPRYVNGKAYVNHNVRCALQQLALESDADEKYAAGILAEVQKWPAIHVEEYV